tara:strand:+ start:7460 stop:7822 length:363 start_codon:yes stop_codon:yes gene_type:complete
MAAGSETANPSTMSGSYSARRHIGIVEDCRQRLRSIGEAIDHLERNPPSDVDREIWNAAIITLAASRVEAMLELDSAMEDFPSARNGRAVMILLAEVKRIEGRLTNFVVSHQLRLPDETS